MGDSPQPEPVTGQLSLLEPPAQPEPEDDPWEDGDPIPYNEFPPGY